MPDIIFRQDEHEPNHRKQNSNRDEAMTQESAFKSWLERGGAQTVAGRNSRAFAIRTIERKLEELGMPFRDLDQAWEADRFESLRERLRCMREDARDGGQDYRILMPDSKNPHKRRETDERLPRPSSPEKSRAARARTLNPAPEPAARSSS